MKAMMFIILLLVVSPKAAHAGHGTMYETDTQIVVEYEGDAEEIKAGNIAKVKEEKLKEQEEKVKAQEADRVTSFTEDHRRLKEERRARFNAGKED